MHPPLTVVEAVSQCLERFTADRRAESADDGPEAALMVEAATAALRGGKRLRARFCHTGWLAAGGAALDAHAITAAAALEVFQAAALVHDDIVDNSDTRRGQPSAHRALEAEHRSRGWSGDAEAFGRAAALLLGDLLVAWSDDLFETALVGAVGADSARHEYARMRRDVTVGQFLDVAEEAAWSTAADQEHADRALRIASMKSARYSVQQPIVIGAALAGADERLLDGLRAFGHPVGMAFQLRDDVLGVFGDPAVTGKPAGDDLREGKRTVLIAYARESLSDSARHVLDLLIGDPTLTDEQIEALQGSIGQTGALDRVEARITDYAAEARLALDTLRIDETSAAELAALAESASRRTA